MAIGRAGPVGKLRNGIEPSEYEQTFIEERKSGIAVNERSGASQE